MGFVSDIGDAARDFGRSVSEAFSGGGRNVGGNQNISNQRPRARPDDLMADRDRDNDTVLYSALGGAIQFRVGAPRVAPERRDRDSSDRSINPDRERQENDEFVTGVTQRAGRGQAVSRRIASETPQRTAARRAASQFRRTGNVGAGQRPLLPVTTASRALKALTGQ